jgi:hypothetical protein
VLRDNLYFQTDTLHTSPLRGTNVTFCLFMLSPGRISQEAEEAAAARQAKIEQHAANAAAAAAAAAAPPVHEHIAKSPSDFSCHSYELFVGQEKGNDDNNKEKMSIRSEGLESVSEITRTTAPTALASAKARKVSTVSMSECFACYSEIQKLSKIRSLGL